MLDVAERGGVANVNVTGNDSYYNAEYADELDSTASTATQRVAL